MLSLKFKYLDLIFALTRREVKIRYLGSVLGSAWNIINPLVMISIYTIIFSKIMSVKLGVDGSSYSYSLYLCSGLLPWNFFLDSLNRSASCLADNSNYLKKIPFPPWLLYISSFFSSTFNFIIAFSIYSIFLIFANEFNIWLVILHFLTSLLFGLFGCMIGFSLSCLQVIIRDVQQMLGVLTQLWFWFTPIIYLASALPEYAKNLLWLNPAYPFIDLLHDIIFFKQPPNIISIALAFLYLTIIFIIGTIIYRKLISFVRDVI